MIKLFLMEGDGQRDWLQTTCEHDVIWSIWAGDCGELSCAHSNQKFQFHAKSQELIDASWSVPLTEHEVLHFLNVVITLIMQFSVPDA